MTAHNSRKASNSRNESYNRTANKVWVPLKTGMLAKTAKSATAWSEPNSSRDNRNITDVNIRRETRNNKDARNSRG
jgi:hypothetical protein